MAKLNQAAVETRGLCDRQTLLNLDLGERALIFCDCEGYENHLFDPGIAQQLRQHDFLIETHDCIKIETTQTMMAIFSATHECKLIESKDDILKAYSYDYPQLKEFTMRERFKILSERRPGIMRWLFATARTGSPSN